MVLLRPEIPKYKSDYEIHPEIISRLQNQSWSLSILDDPSFVPIQFHHRTPPPHLTHRYSFFSQTLKTSETIPLWESFYRVSTSDSDYGEARVIIELGSGMDGHPNTAHGGVAATVLDEVMGIVGYMHKSPGKPIFTAFMRVDYRKAMPTPGLVMGRARLDGAKSGGRKLFVNATLESGDGIVYATAEALFIEVDKPKI